MQIRPTLGQIFENAQTRPNKIFAAKPLLKTVKFSQFGREKTKFPTCCILVIVGPKGINSRKSLAD